MAKRKLEKLYAHPKIPNNKIWRSHLIALCKKWCETVKKHFKTKYPMLKVKTEYYVEFDKDFNTFSTQCLAEIYYKKEHLFSLEGTATDSWFSYEYNRFNHKLKKLGVVRNA